MMVDIRSKKGLPAGWIKTELGDLCEVVRGGSPRPMGSPKYFNAFFSVSFSRVNTDQEFPVKELGKKLGERLGENRLKIEKATLETTQEIEKTTQEMILGLIKTNPAITRKGLAEKIGLTPDGVKYHLNKLREQGVIRHVGATKKGHWEVVEDDE